MRIFLSLIFFLFGCTIYSYGQTLRSRIDRSFQPLSHYSLSPEVPGSLDARQDTAEGGESLPSPNSVMYKSMIIPGWGQVTNNQIWKVPIVYGLLGGLTWYSIDLTRRYHDYRAAYYNLNDQTSDDQRFGPTPDYIPESANLEQLKTIRNTYRNRRDMVYIGIALAYGLNIVDAYVFAHMRSFDVSDNLSMRPSLKPDVMAHAAFGVTLSVELFKKSK
ncbi:DUF5683 domain-containing protein [Fodinibius roseus]|uniref:DUF5683 domain-containing protein n=1 Tax=Fodinibius roseus TaxID=1194090 RepID=UPI000932A943|nr:DUF5683 domain-containing protein [Fodinibius roseus]